MEIDSSVRNIKGVSFYDIFIVYRLCYFLHNKRIKLFRCWRNRNSDPNEKRYGNREFDFPDRSQNMMGSLSGKTGGSKNQVHS